MKIMTRINDLIHPHPWRIQDHSRRIALFQLWCTYLSFISWELHYGFRSDNVLANIPRRSSPLTMRTIILGISAMRFPVTIYQILTTRNTINWPPPRMIDKPCLVPNVGGINRQRLDSALTKCEDITSSAVSGEKSERIASFRKWVDTGRRTPTIDCPL